jgi:hypothetical protein
MNLKQNLKNSSLLKVSWNDMKSEDNDIKAIKIFIGIIILLLASLILIKLCQY